MKRLRLEKEKTNSANIQDGEEEEERVRDSRKLIRKEKNRLIISIGLRSINGRD